MNGPAEGATTVVDILLWQLDEVYQRLRERLDGLTEAEYFWQPVAGCWTVRPDAAGGWSLDDASEPPEPPPFTTIAWRLSHLTNWKVMFHEWTFGSGRPVWSQLPVAAGPAEALARLDEGQRLLRADIAALTDVTVHDPRRTSWNEQRPAWRMAWTLIDHDAQHGAEIGCLRDLYASCSTDRPVTRAGHR